MTRPSNSCSPRLDAMRAPLWPWLLAMLTVVGLLWVFHLVVREAMQQGELRHKAMATRVEGTWRCNTLRGLSVRDNCLVQLNAALDGDAILQTQKVATAGTGGSQWVP